MARSSEHRCSESKEIEWIRQQSHRRSAAFPVAVPISFEGATTGGMDEGEYTRHVQGKTWPELDRAYVSRRVDALSFLAPTHLAAVLPAYLLALVTDGTKTCTGSLLLVLGDDDHRKEALRALLSPDQRSAVRESLSRFASTQTGRLMDALRAAERGWITNKEDG